jgi:predicted enzyme related to lactoylglutathione lyase
MSSVPTSSHYRSATFSGPRRSMKRRLVSLGVDDAQALHDTLKAGGTVILTDPFDTPFGRTFVFQDPDGYAIAIHGSR